VTWTASVPLTLSYSLTVSPDLGVFIPCFL
jgi:hypothetical protein